MRSCGRSNFRKYNEINNGEQYISMEIYLKLDCLDKRGFASSGSRDYVGISGKGMTTSLTPRTRMRSNKKQKSRTVITDIFPNITLSYLNPLRVVPATDDNLISVST